MHRFSPLIIAWALVTAIPASADDVDFVRDIRPLLSENCFFCHGPDSEHREAGLRLDIEDEAHAVIAPGDAKTSELVDRLTTDDADLLMPPPDSNRKLTADQIDLIKQWIDLGAPWQTHWSFRQIEKPPVPSLDPKDGTAEHPIDAFVLERFANSDFGGAKLSPAPTADRRTLARRLSLDLNGLPPTRDQVDRFLADDNPTAYEDYVDRLLASPEFGRRMAWNWLDAARYADTNGYQGDRERTMWPWRDWVVEAFNNNMPFDEFTVHQIAGDLLPDATMEQRLATGFLRNHMINGEGGRIAEENRVEYVMDMAETVGTVWMGLTMNCCRCHDHKYDPLTNQDYYRLFAFFNQTPVSGGGGDPQTKPNLPFPSPQQAAELAQLEQKREELTKQSKDADGDVGDGQNKALEAVKSKIESLQKSIPKVMVMADRATPRSTFMLDRGLYNKPGETVTAAVPEFLPKMSGIPTDKDAPANRLTLARWLVHPDHPLTARVVVNRFWQQIFGIGLVKTTEDFGVQGEIPIQMELLDWLAADFIESGWDVKDLIRKIVLSRTYRQSSDATAFAYQTDPQNRYLARGSRYRMPSWMIRDAALAAAGLLSPSRGGPSVNTYQPSGVWEEASFGKKKYVRDAGEKIYRPSLYVFWRRIIAPTMFFDSASRQTCSVKPNRTNTPLHALMTLNDVTYVEAARVLAESVINGDGTTDRQRLDDVFNRVLSRPASSAEADAMLGGLRDAESKFAESADEPIRLLSIGESEPNAGIDPATHAAWTTLCLAILNLDETLTRE